MAALVTFFNQLVCRKNMCKIETCVFIKEKTTKKKRKNVSL